MVTSPGEGGDQPGTEDPNAPDVIFSENMGSATISKVDGYWPYLNTFTAWSSGLTFTDVNDKTLSVRSVNGVNNIWFPAKKECDLKITGFSTAGYTTLTLTYDVAASLFNNAGEQDAAALTGTFNGQPFATPSKVLSGPAGDNNKFYTFSVELPASAAAAQSELHFLSTAAANTMGLRLANIKLTGKK